MRSRATYTTGDHDQCPLVRGVVHTSGDLGTAYLTPCCGSQAGRGALLKSVKLEVYPDGHRVEETGTKCRKPNNQIPLERLSA